MATVVVCDVCGGDLWVENQHASFKFPKGFWHSPGYDGFTAYMERKRLDICFNCWHDFKDFVAKKAKKS